VAPKEEVHICDISVLCPSPSLRSRVCAAQAVAPWRKKRRLLRRPWLDHLRGRGGDGSFGRSGRRRRDVRRVPFWGGRLIGWLIIGLFIYFGYSRNHSLLGGSQPVRSGGGRTPAPGAAQP